MMKKDLNKTESSIKINALKFIKLVKPKIRTLPQIAR